MSAELSIFGTSKLYQNREDVIINKNHEKIGNIYGHLAKVAIWNLKNCQNFKINEKFEGVADS